jgi:hypothetical protein
MDVEVVEGQMNGSGFGGLKGEVNDHSRKLGRRPIRGGVGEVAAALRFYGAEDIGVAVSRVLAVASRFAPRFGSTSRKINLSVPRMPWIMENPSFKCDILGFLSCDCTILSHRKLENKNLQPRAVPVGEPEQMTAEGVFAERVAHKAEQTIEALAHVSGAGGEKDASGGGEAEHR